MTRVQQLQFASAATAVAGVALALLAFLTYREPDEGPWPPARTALRPDVLGCYALFDRTGVLLDTSYYNASSRIRLDSAEAGFNTSSDTIPGVHRRLLVHPAPELGPAESRMRRSWLRWWADANSDSVRLSFSTGFSGAALVLNAPQGVEDTLRGRIVEHWDFGPPFTTQRGPGYAVRIPCDAPAGEPVAAPDNAR